VDLRAVFDWESIGMVIAGNGMFFFNIGTTRHCPRLRFSGPKETGHASGNVQYPCNALTSALVQAKAWAISLVLETIWYIQLSTLLSDLEIIFI